MTDLQNEFLGELKSKKELTVAEYATIYNKYCKVAIEHEVKKGAGEHKAKAMGNYYIDAVLTDFINNQSLLDQIIDLKK